jgi:germacradienol/geosmin synthase
MPYVDHTTFLPGFHDPGEHVVNPLTPAAMDVSVAWLWRVGILANPAHERQLRSFDLGTINGAGVPDVGLDQLVITQKALIWFVLLDDQMDNARLSDPAARIRVVRDGVRAVFDHPERVPPDPFLAALADIWAELRVGCTEVARRRFADRLLEYFDGIERQAQYADAGSVPDLLEFLTMRRATVGMPAWAEFLDTALGLHVPDDVRDQYVLREIVECSSDIQGIGQDVRSFEKEELDGYGCNIVPVLRKALGCSAAEAVARALAMHRERQHTLLRAERQLPRLMMRLGYADRTADACRFVWAVKAIAFALHYWFASPANRRYELDHPRVTGTFDIRI